MNEKKKKSKRERLVGNAECGATSLGLGKVAGEEEREDHRAPAPCQDAVPRKEGWHLLPW